MSIAMIQRTKYEVKNYQVQKSNVHLRFMNYQINKRRNIMTMAILSSFTRPHVTSRKSLHINAVQNTLKLINYQIGYKKSYVQSVSEREIKKEIKKGFGQMGTWEESFETAALAVYLSGPWLVCLLVHVINHVLQNNFQLELLLKK